MSQTETNASPRYDGNPQFMDASTEAPELAKIQLQNQLETAKEDFVKSENILRNADASNGMVDVDAARQLVHTRRAEYDELQKQWDEQYGDTETP